MKERYEKPEAEIVEFKEEDTVMCNNFSGDDGKIEEW